MESGQTHHLEIENEIKLLLVNRFGIPRDIELFKSDQLEKLGLNVLSVIQFIDQIEKKFGVTISAAEERQIKTIGDVVNVVQAKIHLKEHNHGFRK